MGAEGHLLNFCHLLNHIGVTLTNVGCKLNQIGEKKGKIKLKRGLGGLLRPPRCLLGAYLVHHWCSLGASLVHPCNRRLGPRAVFGGPSWAI